MKTPIILENREILEILKRHGVPLQKWGMGKYRSFEDFMRYATEDQFFLRDGDGNGLVVEVHAAVVIVIHKFRKEWLELYEDRQVSSNGKVLCRKNFNGIAETL